MFFESLDMVQYKSEENTRFFSGFPLKIRTIFPPFSMQKFQQFLAIFPLKSKVFIKSWYVTLKIRQLSKFKY